jgi:hypothetical protein
VSGAMIWFDGMGAHDSWMDPAAGLPLLRGPGGGSTRVQRSHGSSVSVTGRGWPGGPWTPVMGWVGWVGGEARPSLVTWPDPTHRPRGPRAPRLDPSRKWTWAPDLGVRPTPPSAIASSAPLCSSNRTRARDSPPLSSSCSRRSAGLAHPPPPCSPPQHPRPAAAPPRAPSPNPSLAISPHCPGATTCPALRVAGGADRRHCLTEASESRRVGMRW